MKRRDTARAKRVQSIMPFNARLGQSTGRVIGRLLPFPLFRPDDGTSDIEFSWYVADKLSAQ